MTKATGTPISAPIATEPGTPVVVSMLVQVGDDRAVHFSVDATASPGVNPHRVADALAGALRRQVTDYAEDQMFGKVPDLLSDPSLVDALDGHLFELDDPDDPS